MFIGMCGKKVVLSVAVLIAIGFSNVALAGLFGGNKKLADGSCKFKIEAGFSWATLYVNEKQEAFLVMRIEDVRYGDMENVYDANSCKSITSGLAKDSNFSSVMAEDKFHQVAFFSGTTGVEDSIDPWFITLTSLGLDDSNKSLISKITKVDTSLSNQLSSVGSYLLGRTASLDVSSIAQLENNNYLESEPFKAVLKSVKSHFSVSNKQRVATLLKIRQTYKSSKLDAIVTNLVNEDLYKYFNSVPRTDALAMAKDFYDKSNAGTDVELFNASVKSIADVPSWAQLMTSMGQPTNALLANIQTLPDFGKNVTVDNFLESTEYNYALKYFTPKITATKDLKFGFSLSYPNSNIGLFRESNCKATTQKTERVALTGFFNNVFVGDYYDNDYQDYLCSASYAGFEKVEMQITSSSSISNTFSGQWKISKLIKQTAGTYPRTYPTSGGYSGDTDSDAVPASASGWKFKKQYEGGFAEFGLDERRMIYVIECGSGHDRSLYQDKKGKWGKLGGIWNNEYSSIEKAADDACGN